MSGEAIKKRVGVTIEPDLARRFEIAADNHDLVPRHNSGRLAWIAAKMKEHHGIEVTRETVRKWFRGEARPRADKMMALAAVLRVSESWLAFGIERERGSENTAKSIVAGYAVNLVFGLFGLNGAECAIPDKHDPQAAHVHFYAIMNGRLSLVYVSAGEATAKRCVRFNLNSRYETLLNIGVVQRLPTQFDFYLIPSTVIAKNGYRRGGHLELLVRENDKGELAVKNVILPRIEDLLSLRREAAAF